MIKAGFIVRNKFQIRQFEAFAVSFPGADYLLYDRKGLQQEFASDEFAAFKLPIRLFNRHDVMNMVSSYDAIFFQTIFPGIESISDIPLISVQYGLAKERHNYGEWRSLADLNLMYGQYSADCVAHYGPSVAVGNLKFCGWDYRLTAAQKAEAKRRLGLSASVPVILYMPTYGELGSFDELVEPLAMLGGRYQVMIKGHHNDEMSGAGWMAKARAFGHRHLFSGGFDQMQLLEAADVVVSDLSGAVFDAVYARIPVILYHGGAEQRVGLQKFDLSSLEYRERDRLGKVCLDVADLSAAIDEVIAEPTKFVEQAADLRRQLFVDVTRPDAVCLAKFKVEDLLSGKLPKFSKPQTYIREAVRRLLVVERAAREPRQARKLLSSLRNWISARLRRTPAVLKQYHL